MLVSAGLVALSRRPGVPELEPLNRPMSTLPTQVELPHFAPEAPIVMGKNRGAFEPVQ